MNGTCARCWTAFTDSFGAGAPQWTLSSATVTGGALEFPVMSRPSQPDSASAQTTQALPLRGCGVTVQLTSQPNVANNFSGRLGLFPSSGTVPSFRWEMDGRGLVAAWTLTDGGAGASVVAGPSATWPAYLRIEERAGVVQFRTATIAVPTFSTVATAPHGEVLEALVLRASSAYPAQPGNDRTSFAIDNVNLAP